MKKLFTNREALLFMLIVAMLLSVGSVAKDFLSLTNLLSAYNDTSILIILALGQMLVIITRCIDLSVAANLALTGMAVAMLNSSYPDFPVPMLVLFGMLLGLTMGMINGLLVWKLEIPRYCGHTGHYEYLPRYYFPAK